MIPVLPQFVKDNIQNAAASAAAQVLSLAEGLAVGALILSGVCLMGANQDPVQRAVVLTVAVVSTGLNGALDALICVIVHFLFLLLFGFLPSMPDDNGIITAILLLIKKCGMLYFK